MSTTTVLGIAPNKLSVQLAEFRNSHGWAPSIWRRLCAHNRLAEPFNYRGGKSGLDDLWKLTEQLPEWQQAPLVLTFDTGIIPWQAFPWAADMLTEFDGRLPENPDYVNHVPAAAELLRKGPEVPWLGVWGTSVSENCFEEWDEDTEKPAPLAWEVGTFYVLPQHRSHFGAASLSTE